MVCEKILYVKCENAQLDFFDFILVGLLNQVLYSQLDRTAGSTGETGEKERREEGRGRVERRERGRG